jgi:hypothetical protein
LPTWGLLLFLAFLPHAAAAHETQVLVKLVTGSDDGGRIAAEASRVAGVPVRYVSAIDLRWHSLALQCPTDGDCDSAYRRLADARSIYAAVEHDERRHPEPSP